MNRRDRRAAGKRGAGAGAPGPARAPDNAATLFGQAIRHHQLGELAEAERLYRDILARDPNHVKSLNFLGLLAHQTGRNDAAAQLIGKAIAVDSTNAESHYNLAVVLQALDRHADATSHYQRAIVLRPDYAEAIMNLGNAYLQLGRPDDAVAAYERVLALRPDTAAAHYNIANIFATRGDLDAAAERYRAAIAVKPDLVEAHNNLGNILKELGRPAAAREHYERALALQPNSVATQDNLARLLLSVGQISEAFDLLRRALALAPSNTTKILLVRCLQNLQPTSDDPDLRALILRALTECWLGANELSGIVGTFLKQAVHIRDGMAAANRAWPQRPTWDALLGPSGFAALASDRLLCALLENAPICDVELERLLTAIRFALLRADRDGGQPVAASGDGLRFCCALARHCFINEYIFPSTAQEIGEVERLRDEVASALAAGAGVAPARLATLAAYVPLHAVEGVDALLGRSWPQAFDALLTQQVREPRLEREGLATIPALTAIDDEVSIAVMRQYEENPYPRWSAAPTSGVAVRIEDDLRARFPHVRIDRFGADRPLDVLIAGCGTGRHTVEFAQRFANVRIVCVDLSRTSLAYAQRKTAELGLTNIEYAQADILKLDSIGRSFDVIESNGVLHHLADPFVGWRVLLSLLRPRGLMNIGLYSDLARRDINAVRAHIAAKGYGHGADDIRACRQELMADPDGALLSHIVWSLDFYTVSACRDLLFHVQECQLTLPQIGGFLAANDLRFLGFDLDIRMLQRFSKKFSDPRAVTELDRWHEFELENPKTFAAMYQFWVQRGA